MNRIKTSTSLYRNSKQDGHVLLYNSQVYLAIIYNASTQ